MTAAQSPQRPPNPTKATDKRRLWGGRHLQALPLLRSLHGYQRSWLGADALAALALVVIALPEQLATSRLAGMPPVTGWYAFVAGTVAFALLGRNARMSVGADSTIAPLFAVGVAHLAPEGSNHYVALVSILAVFVGAIVVVAGLLRFGWVADFLSAPLITGFLAGVAVIIVVHQLPDLLGLPASSGSTLHRLGSVITELSSVHGWSLGIGIAVFAIIAISRRVDRRLPGAFVGLVCSTGLVAGLNLTRHGVSVLGRIASSAPKLGLSGLSWSTLGSLAPLAAVVALVVVSQSAATTRAFPATEEQPGDVARDFIGVGAGSLAAGLVGSFPVNASPPRTAVVASTGGRSQLAGLAAAATIVVLLPFAGLLRDLPLATLSAVLIFVAVRIFRLGELISVLRFDLWEFGLAIATLLVVALVGVEQGIGVAVGLAILDRTRRSARPKAHPMGRLPGSTSWEPLDTGQGLLQVPGVLVVLFAAPLYFANAGQFRSQLDAALAEDPARPRVLVLDLIGMHDVDYTGAQAISALITDLEHKGVSLGLARVGQHLLGNLTRSGLLQRIGRDKIFASADEAVRALAPERPAN